MDVYASVDMGGTKMAAAIAATDGSLVAERTVPTESHEGPVRVLERMGGCVAALCEEADAQLLSLGVGLPGLLDLASGKSLFLPNLPTKWRDVPVVEPLRARLACNVRILNDARMATLGELIFGAGRGVATMALFTLGTGIGGGLVVDGKLRLGPLGAAGELGHQTIIPDGPLCGCGNRGCLEALASASAVTAEGVRLLRSGLAPALHEMVGGDAGRVNPKVMAEAAQAGDDAAREAIERAARYIGIGAANVATAIHPELILLTGGMSALGEILLAAVREELTRRARMIPAGGIRVERASLGEKAGLWGGIALAMGRGVA